MSVTDPGFNPSGDPKILELKNKVNELAMLIEAVPGVQRRGIALMNLEQAAMWAVKAIACGDE